MADLKVPKEIKKEGKGLSITEVKSAISALQEVLRDREKEVQVISDIEALARQNGFSLKQLGFAFESLPDDTDSTKKSKRPTKPKFKTINPDNQYFYIEDGKLELLKTHTMKKGLQGRGIEVFPFHRLNPDQHTQAKMLIDEAIAQSVKNYNSKVDEWNEYAVMNELEVLNKMS